MVPSGVTLETGDRRSSGARPRGRLRLPRACARIVRVQAACALGAKAAHGRFCGRAGGRALKMGRRPWIVVAPRGRPWLRGVVGVHAWRVDVTNSVGAISSGASTRLPLFQGRYSHSCALSCRCHSVLWNMQHEAAIRRVLCPHQASMSCI